MNVLELFLAVLLALLVRDLIHRALRTYLAGVVWTRWRDGGGASGKTRRAIWERRLHPVLRYLGDTTNRPSPNRRLI